MALDFRVISIGSLQTHPLRPKPWTQRMGHATTTLISTGREHVLVDPALPNDALAARLAERTDLGAEAIDHVFLTSFQADHRRALALFQNARWLLSEAELDAAAASLRSQREESGDAGDAELRGLVEADLAVLERCEAAADTILPGVDLFPLPGVTAGTCGLLLPLPQVTVLICGDAVATLEHLSAGKVLPQCVDVEQAQESFREAVEIADLLVLGRDNLALNPLRAAM